MEKTNSSGGRWLTVLAVATTLLTIITLGWNNWVGETDPDEYSSRAAERLLRDETEKPKASVQAAVSGSGKPSAETFVFETKVEQARLLEQIEAALQQMPGESKLLHLAAVTYAEILQTDRAAELFKKAIASDPKDINIAKDYADILLQVGKPDEAAEVLLAIKSPPLDIELALAESQSQAGNLEQAASRLTEIVGDHPNAPELRLKLAQLQNQLSNFEDAELNARFAAEKLPTRREAFIALATALVRQGKRDEAREVQNTMPKIDRESTVDDAGYQESFRNFAAHTYSVLASIYVARGLYSEAGNEVDRALLLRPEGDEPLTAKVDLLRRQRDAPQAYQYQSKLADSFPDNAFHQVNAASLAAAVGRVSEAESYMQRAVLLDTSGNTDARLANLLSAMGKHDEAIASARIAVERLANKDAYLLLIGCLQQAGRQAEAVTTLLQAQQLFPGQPEFVRP